MSQHAPSPPTSPGNPVTLNRGLEAFQTSPEFHGPVEDLDGHACNDHFAHIYETSAEKFAAAVPFVQHGLDRGERIMYVVDESTEVDVKAALRDGGIDVAAATESGALSFHTVQDTYLRDGAFDVDEMIDFYGDTVTEVTDEYEALRIVAEMTWITASDTSVEQFMEYEQRINELFAETESLAVCQYNRDLFDPAAIRDVVRSHPHLIYDGAACHNFYYTPPEEFFDDDAPARENDRILNTLRDRAAAKAELQSREQFMEKLHAVTADSTRSFEAKMHDLLDLGAEWFGLDIGYFNRIDGDEVEIVDTVGPHELLEPGAADPIEESYCGKVLASSGEFAVPDATEAEWTDDDTAYETFGFDAYLGTTVHVGGDEYGTLCFASETPRDEPFSDVETTFLDLMAQWVEAEIERQRRERFLQKSYQITSDPALDFEAKLEELLDLACDWMGLDAAGVTHLPEWDGKFLNEYTVGYGEDTDGAVWTDPGEGCYCRAVIESDTAVGKSDVRGTPWEHDEIHHKHGLSCYLGTKVTNGSTPYGTLWVGSPDPRDHDFTETERTFLELLGQWVSYELERHNHHDAQQRLYEITSDPSRDFDEKLDGVFELGRDRFGLDVGGLAKIDPETDYFEVETMSGDHDHLVPGNQYPLSETYCRLVTEDAETAAVTDPVDAGFEGHLCYERFGVQTYLGAHLEIDGDMDRTFWFLSNETHDDPITDEEQTFVDLMGQWVQYELERQQREHELRERTDHLNALIETTPECIKTVAPDGTLLQMNDAGLEMVEALEEAAVTGENVYDLIAPEHRERFREFNERVCAGQSGTLEFDIIGLDGTRRHMESHAKPLERPDGTTVHVALTRDVTEQKERKAELERALDMLEKTEHIADVGGWELDPETNDVFWTDHLYELKGVSGDEELAMNEMIEMYHEADQPIIEDAVEAALDSGEPFDLEVRLRNSPDDEVRWLRLQGVPETVDGEVVMIRGAAQDITERKEREHELRQTKDRFETVFEDSNDSIFIIDPDADEFVDANPAAAAMTGYTRDELLSQQTPSSLHPDELEQFRAFLAEVQETGSAWTEDLHCRAKDGRKIPAEISASTITLDGRDLVLALVRNITERKKHERYQRDLHEITADPDLGFDEKLERVLELGCDRFGLEMGGLNHLPSWDGKFRLEAGVGIDIDLDEENHWTDPRNDCYCRRAVDTDEPIGRPDVRGTAWEDDMVYQEFGITSYLGTTVDTGAMPYGTLWFGSTNPRDTGFTDAERSFIDLMSQWLGYEIERREHKQSQRDLYEITADTTLDTDEKIQQLLELGCDRLNLSVGMLNRDHGDALEIQQMHGDHPDVSAGACLPPTEGYCREVITTAAPEMIPDAAAAGWADDPLYTEVGLETYAGVPVTGDGQTYGTLCFVDTTPQRADFTDAERSFLDLMGQCVGYELDRRERENRLTALGTLGRELLDAETPTAVADHTVDIIDVKDTITEAAIALYDEDTGDLRLTARTDGLTDYPVESLLTRGDGVGWDAFVSGDAHRVTAPFAGTAADADIVEVVAHSLGTHGVVLFGATDPNGFSHGAATTIDTAVTTLRAALGRADREQQLQDREEILEAQNQKLSRLNRINDTIRSIDKALVEATTRDEIEQVVCEELATIGPYELAWVGEHGKITGEITPREVAGAEKGYLEATTITVDDGPEGCGPTGRAVKTGEPQFVDNVLTDESFEPWRQDALDRGYHATAAFPLVYDDTQYGVLNLYAGQPGVFDDLEREVLTELSATIAHALNAIETKKGLVSSTADELVFDVTDDSFELLAMTQELDCEFELKRLVPRDNGGICAFFAVDGATPDEVRAFRPRLPVEELRLVSEGIDDGVDLFEAVLTEGSLGQTVIDHGGRLRSVEITDGSASVVVQLGADADTWTFVDMIKRKYPDSELRANQTVQLSHKSALEFAETLMEDLTDRQREALETAYFSGYFEEPRNRTASEIADAMGITQPTFNSHFRAAMRKLHRRLFEET